MNHLQIPGGETSGQSRLPESASAIRRLTRPRDDAPSMVSKTLDTHTRELIDEAIAAGKITRCPPGKHSVEAGDWLPGEGSWREPKGRRGRKSKFNFRREG